ncbi:MAG: hypothetical protein ACLFU0_00895 [Alphaproteobacteria bacterium]
MRRAHRGAHGRTGVRVLEAIRRVNREVGATTAVITDSAAKADRVLAPGDGRIKADGRNPRAGADRGALLVSVVDTKLVGDRVRLRGRVVAIALVTGAGLAVLVTSLGSVVSLAATRRAGDERAGFARVFATRERAPDHLAARFAAADGVRRVETPIVREVALALLGFAEPLPGRLISLPAHGGWRLERLDLVAVLKTRERGGLARAAPLLIPAPESSRALVAALARAEAEQEVRRFELDNARAALKEPGAEAADAKTYASRCAHGRRRAAIRATSR